MDNTPMEVNQVEFSGLGARSPEQSGLKVANSGSFSVLKENAPVFRQSQAGNANTTSLPFGTVPLQSLGSHTQVSAQQSRPLPLMSTIGFGVDTSDSCSWDATEASVRALRDAMERSTFHVGGESQTPLQIHVKLGVPPKQDCSTETMKVDTRIVSSLLPRSIPVLPLEIVVGGLNISGHEAADPSICTAVAYVSILSKPIAPAARATSSWATTEQQRQPAQLPRPVPPVRSPANSMDMLALISAQMRERHVEVDTRLADEASMSIPSTVTDNIDYTDERSLSVSPDALKQRKKLPPGTTAKNNVRHFAQHNYHDHSVETLPEEEAPIFGNKLQMNAFPVKLHEALSHIDTDGHSDVIGWMPHGRSFKIHKQQDFLDEILPKYFVMTKKSSFLRQLNLYGFNRISSGPDKNSYYHELFLRGMLFLSHRICRTKVNGNMIRSAADPESEPNFYTMPLVPRNIAHSELGLRSFVQSLPSSYPVSRDNSEEENTVARDGEEEDEPYEDDDAGSHRINNNNNNNQASFPLKLQCMLDKLEADGITHIISWQPHGRAFRVHDPEAFVRELMPLYFRQSKYPSFQRQLHLYSFQRISSGKDKGAYYHEKCLRGMPALCDYIKRVRVNGKKCRKPRNPFDEPNFYDLDYIEPIPRGTIIDVPAQE